MTRNPSWDLKDNAPMLLIVYSLIIISLTLLTNKLARAQGPFIRMEMQDESCFICSGLTGLMRHYDQISLNPLDKVVEVELSESDLYATFQCSAGYQCVLETDSKSTGCCEKCAAFQSCPAGSISYLTDLEYINGCPIGHFCNDEGLSSVDLVSYDYELLVFLS